MKHLLPEIRYRLDLFKVDNEVISFDSGAVMVDVFLRDKLHVIQIDGNSIGLSEVTNDTMPFDLVPDKTFQHRDAFMEAFDALFDGLPIPEIKIDCTYIENIRDFHALLARKLLFPSFYGHNWSAFWDAITGLVQMPQELIFLNYASFKNKFPDDAAILEKCLSDMNEMYPAIKCRVNYN